MTTPTILPTQYQGNRTDFLNLKLDRSGAARIHAGAVTIPTGTVAGSTVGLVPFRKGARFLIHSSSVYVNAIGAGTTTATLGFVYDDNVTFTNNLTAWASGSTAPQAGGFVTVNQPAGLSFVAAADGWIVFQTLTATTNNTADIVFEFAGAYDGLGVNNQNGQA